jgi:hypothetical protein
MIGGMIMENLDDKGVLAGIKIIIPQGMRIEKHMHVQGREESKVYLLLGIREGGMGQIACKGS